MPPFISKEDNQVAGASCAALGKARRRSFRKRREKPKMEHWKGGPGDPKGLDSEDISIPGGVDLLALPQLCFPGTVHTGQTGWPCAGLLQRGLFLEVPTLRTVG